MRLKLLKDSILEISLLAQNNLRSLLEHPKTIGFFNLITTLKIYREKKFPKRGKKI